MVPHREPEQKPGSPIQGHSLCSWLEGKDNIHPNVIDAAIEAKILPDSWKVDGEGNTLYHFSWAIGFRNADGDRCVRCWYWRDGGYWRHGYRWLFDAWHVSDSAFVAS